MSERKLISSYEVTGTHIAIRTPYCDDVVETCRRWGGKWRDGSWQISTGRLNVVEVRLGRNLDDLVEVEVGIEQCDSSPYNAQIRLGWYVLAGRRKSGYRAEVYAELVSGSIPLTGGTRTEASVNPSQDARFRLWVPRSFATERQLQVVTDPTMVNGRIATSTDPRQDTIEHIRGLMRDYGITVEDIGASVPLKPIEEESPVSPVSSMEECNEVYADDPRFDDAELLAWEKRKEAEEHEPDQREEAMMERVESEDDIPF